MDVPLYPQLYLLVGTLEQMLTPGATTSGFKASSNAEGPRDEKYAIVLVLSTAPLAKDSG